ncbi:hypothetical protein ELG79_36575 [Rhizobium leguminosarum]|uniref:hypothetical protein n=1 Tax=Rhizobium leguminosarum TaxID=384 RepID=UPI00102F4F4F|nr:hypothetical protein [Rhizobium leguminosarum]TBG08439.1 hypothetical protein ELG79_36575 [Rhizobium leguminosarum]
MTFLGVSSAAWFPVITLIAGAVLKGGFDLLAEKRAERREQNLRQEQRRDGMHLKRIEFQHATLLEFQEVVGRLVRLVGRAHHVDQLNCRSSGDWERSRLPDNLDQDILAEQATFTRLRVRIRDEMARALADQFSGAAVAVFMSRTQSDAEAAIKATTGYLVSLNDRIGVLLRELDLEGDEAAGRVAIKA